MDQLKCRPLISTALNSSLDTQVWPRAGTSESFNQVTSQLASVPDEHLYAKLVLAGFTNHPVSVDDLDQSCETCIYYLVHKQFCNLPELRLPVEPQWSCRLWRI